MCRLHDRLSMQLHERCFDENAWHSQSSASVRGCRDRWPCIHVHDVLPSPGTHSCGPEPSNNNTWNYANCTYGPKQPFYWYQAERNNMLEGTYTPPLYQDLYNFHDGAQNDIFTNTTSTRRSSDGVHTEERALRRAWGARHRRSVGKHHPSARAAEGFC